MKKITISSTKKKSTLSVSHSELLANQLLLGSGFSDGTKAYVKYSHNKLTIIVGKKPKVLE